ncbi:MAG: hypothetical protein EPN82_08195 [Bacteroidetes bacterium]|nr:MAG: hypothetical protein EPN82_08195 [Bacteroidota bacterium]
MKKIILFSAIAICVALFTGCNNNDSGTNPTDNNEPLVTPVGTPLGPAVTATIDASGGSLSSADGILELTVPAGAVSSATVFSIQPVTSHCPGGFGIAYRLLPEGIKFAQLVTVTFSYADTLPANEEFLGIAYQDTDKTWLAPKVFSLDVVEKKISVQIKHFCDVSEFEKISIVPSEAIVKINESIDLEVIYIGEPKYKTEENVDLPYLNENKTYVSTWQVNGTSGNAASGQIVKTDENKATFIAPSVVPDESHNPVAVSATLSNLTFTYKDKTFKNPKLISNILVIEGALYSIVFTSNIPLGFGAGKKFFTVTDSARMSVLLKDDLSVMVLNLYNEEAKVTPKSQSEGTCTYTITQPGDGYFNISNGVSFGGSFNPLEHQINIFMNGNSWGYTPSFKISCKDAPPWSEPGSKTVTGPLGLTFDANKDYQELVEKIPDGGGTLPDGIVKTTVTKVK